MNSGRTTEVSRQRWVQWAGGHAQLQQTTNYTHPFDFSHTQKHRPHSHWTWGYDLHKNNGKKAPFSIMDSGK